MWYRVGGGLLLGAIVLGFEEAAHALTGQPAIPAGFMGYFLLGYAAMGLCSAALPFRLPWSVASVYLGLWLVGRVGHWLDLQALAWFALPLPSIAALAAKKLPDPWHERIGIAALGAVPILAVVHLYSPESILSLRLILTTLAIAGLAAAIPWHRFERGPLVATGLVVPWGYVALSAAVTAPRAPDPIIGEDPPILLIIVDTLRADAIGAWGNSTAKTPNFDRLASKSVVFANAQSAAPWTTPAIASLLTGLSPHEHGAGLDPGPPRRFTGINSDVPSLVEQLQPRQRTGAIVSNVFLRRFSGLSKGFDLYDDRATGHDPLLIQLWDSFFRDPMDASRYLPADQVTDRAIKWYEHMGSSPSFLMVHYMDPHTPYRAAPEFHHGPAPVEPEERAKWEYAAEVRFVDQQLGRLLSSVPQNTWVVLVADHGEEFGEHSGAYPTEAIPEGTRHGHTLYQELLHVPLMIRMPGLKPTVVSRPVSTKDVLPSLLAALNDRAAPLGEITHTPLEPALPLLSESLVFGREQKALRFDHWKWIARADGQELYDLSADPAERDNVAWSQPELIDSLHQFLPQAQVPGTGGPDEATLEQLRRLGYRE